jgi:radical SAM/Cys-rich protein
MTGFADTLRRHGLELSRESASTLQVNVGLLCDQTCRHCHLQAGPGRTEVMDRGTVDQVLAYARRGSFACLDITGGAPELNPNLERLLEGAADIAPRVMLRSNLTALGRAGQELVETLTGLGVEVVASFPSLSRDQASSLRGEGYFQPALDTLTRLNALGFGRPESSLKLHLVANPAGAFLPGSQDALTKRYRQEMARRWGLVFNELYLLGNAPLGRFRSWLESSGNYQPYVDKLACAFNPATVSGLMCRSLVSVAWDGFLYDCDFNQAAGLPLGGRKTHVGEMEGPPPPQSLIATGEHCYTCTAGAGFT